MSPYFHDSPKGQLFQKLAKMSDAEIRNIHGNFVHRKTKSIDIDQRPVTAPAVMTMEEYRAKIGQNSASSKGRNSKQSRVSSGYGSMEDNLDDLSATSTSKHTVDFKIVEENEKTCESKHESDKAETVSSVNEILDEVKCDEENINISRESVETSVSDKIKLMMAEKQAVYSGRQRAVSAYEPREKQLRSTGAEVGLNGQEGHPRSKSAAGYNRTPAVEDIAPMPYMDHSKPKVISVGSIGKISLLESISEAKFWEDLALEEQKVSSKPNTEIIEEAKNEDIGAESIAEDAVDDVYIEDKISSQPNKIKVNGKEKTDDSLDEIDILSLLLEEEKMHRKKQKSYHKRSKFDFAPVRAVSAGSGSSKSSRIGSSNSRCSGSSGRRSVEPGVNMKVQFSPTESPTQQSSSLRQKNQVLEKNEAKEKKIQKRVVVKDVNETRKASDKPAVNKYERLIKRLGDDISPYMRKQMMKAAT